MDGYCFGKTERAILSTRKGVELIQCHIIKEKMSVGDWNVKSGKKWDLNSTYYDYN